MAMAEVMVEDIAMEFVKKVDAMTTVMVEFVKKVEAMMARAVVEGVTIESILI
jgi:hypothetical protein